MCCAAYVI